MSRKRVIQVQAFIDVLPESCKHIYSQTIAVMLPETEDQRTERLCSKSGDDGKPMVWQTIHFYECDEQAYQTLINDNFFIEPHAQKRDRFHAQIGWNPPKS